MRKNTMLWITKYLMIFSAFFSFYGSAAQAEWVENGEFANTNYYEQECPPYYSWFASFFPVEGEIFIAYDTFRGLPDGSFQDNSGAVIGCNLTLPLSISCCEGIGFQFGTSYGVYDWPGRNSAPFHRKEVQQQTFVTGGIFRVTPCCSGINVGIVCDWMFNKNFSVFSTRPAFGQIRFKSGYLFQCCNEFGLWGTANLGTTHKPVLGIPIAYRALSQLNFFWQHNFANCAQTMVWAGAPYTKGLMFENKSDGKFILGASFEAPLTRCWSVKGHASYMSPRGRFKSNNYGSNICLSLSYFFGCPGECGCPDFSRSSYLPIADNSNFMVDTALNF